jgi:hypothetical protein
MKVVWVRNAQTVKTISRQHKHMKVPNIPGVKSVGFDFPSKMALMRVHSGQACQKVSDVTTREPANSGDE